MATIKHQATIATDPTAERTVAGIQDMIARFRCAGMGRMVNAGVSMTNMHVLWLLEHHGELSMSGLAELLGVSVSNATGIVDRMEERGLVDRVRVPDDRRLVLVRIGPSGIQALEETEAIKHDRLTAILSHLDSPQMLRLGAALDDIRAALTAEFGSDFVGHSHTHDRDPKEATSN